MADELQCPVCRSTIGKNARAEGKCLGCGWRLPEPTEVRLEKVEPKSHPFQGGPVAGSESKEVIDLTPFQVPDHPAAIIETFNLCGVERQVFGNPQWCYLGQKHAGGCVFTDLRGLLWRFVNPGEEAKGMKLQMPLQARLEKHGRCGHKYVQGDGTAFWCILYDTHPAGAHFYEKREGVEGKLLELDEQLGIKALPSFSELEMRALHIHGRPRPPRFLDYPAELRKPLSPEEKAALEARVGKAIEDIRELLKKNPPGPMAILDSMTGLAPGEIPLGLAEPCTLASIAEPRKPRLEELPGHITGRWTGSEPNVQDIPKCRTKDDLDGRCLKPGGHEGDHLFATPSRMHEWAAPKKLFQLTWRELARQAHDVARYLGLCGQGPVVGGHILCASAQGHPGACELSSAGQVLDMVLPFRLEPEKTCGYSMHPPVTGRLSCKTENLANAPKTVRPPWDRATRRHMLPPHARCELIARTSNMLYDARDEWEGEFGAEVAYLLAAIAKGTVIELGQDSPLLECLTEPDGQGVPRVVPHDTLWDYIDVMDGGA